MSANSLRQAAQLELAVRIELTTPRLQGGSSTVELRQPSNRDQQYNQNIEKTQARRDFLSADSVRPCLCS